MEQVATSSGVIAGWLLSPHQEVCDDAKRNETADDHKAMDRLIEKLHHHKRDTEIDTTKDEFWTEWAAFQSKEGHCHSQKCMCNSKLLQLCKSAKWHAQCGVPFTEALDKVACLVLSKTFGILNAERAWGSAKHLKTDKQSLLSGEKTKMQSTIFGVVCMQRAKISSKEKMSLVLCGLTKMLLLN